MIKNSHKQTGSAHVVIIIILVVALLGTLGFVLWQNFINKDTDKKQESTTQTKPIEDKSIKAEKLTESYVMPEENLSFNYPSTWKLTTLRDSSAGENRALLVSPGNFALQISVPTPSFGPNWPFGERIVSCPFDENYDPNTGYSGDPSIRDDVCPTYNELISEPSPNLNNLSIMAFEGTFPKSDTSSSFVSLSLVKDGCKGFDRALCERPDAKVGGLYVDIHGQYYDEISEKSKNMAGIYSDFTVKKITGNDFKKSQDVLTAIAILKSMKY